MKITNIEEYEFALERLEQIQEEYDKLEEELDRLEIEHTLVRASLINYDNEKVLKTINLIIKKIRKRYKKHYPDINIIPNYDKEVDMWIVEYDKDLAYVDRKFESFMNRIDIYLRSLNLYNICFVFQWQKKLNDK